MGGRGSRARGSSAAASCAKIDFSRGRKSEARAVRWCLCAAVLGYLRQLPDLILPPGSRRKTLVDQALLLSGHARADTLSPSRFKNLILQARHGLNPVVPRAPHRML